MESSQLNRSRFIVGIILVVIAVLMFLFGKGDYSTAGATGIGVLGLLSIGISRRKQIANSRLPNTRCSRPFDKLRAGELKRYAAAADQT